MRKAFLWTMIVSLALTALVGIAALLIPDLGPQEELLTTVALFGVFSLVALICATVLERRRLVPLAWIGIGASVVGLLGWVTLVWFYSSITNDERVAQVAGSFSVLAAQAAHMGSLALPAFGRVWAGRVRWATAFAGATLALVGLVLIWWGDRIADLVGEDPLVRVCGTLGILVACGTVVTPILWKVQQVQRRESKGSIDGGVLVAVICPRCRTRSERPSGPGRCPECGLRISVEVEEPHCVCGYLLHRLEGDRCPECGRPVPEHDRWAADRGEG